jgi:predicted RNA-binding protein YlqC (UPF0109 family)
MPKTELTDQEYVEAIVKPIVDHPDDVITTRTVDEMGVLIQMTVNPEDMGKVIGREGRTAKAVRSLLRVMGSRQNARINLKIVEPEGSEPANAKEPKSDVPKDIPIAEDKADQSEQVTSVI